MPPTVQNTFVFFECAVVDNVLSQCNVERKQVLLTAAKNGNKCQSVVKHFQGEEN